MHAGEDGKMNAGWAGLGGEPMHLLFVCSRNQWRSPTAESVYARQPGVRVRSRGVSASARRRLTGSDLRWADVVFVMEEQHAERIADSFPNEFAAVSIVVLDIPDEYRFMDPALIEMIRGAVDPILVSRGVT